MFEGEILKLSLDAFILNSDISFEDFEGNAKLMVPTKKDITPKTINNSINFFNLICFGQC